MVECPKPRRARPGWCALPLYKRVKSLKSLDFNGVFRGWAFTSHMRDEAQKTAGEGRTWPDHIKVKGSTLGSYLKLVVGHRRARSGATLITIISTVLYSKIKFKFHHTT